VYLNDAHIYVGFETTSEDSIVYGNAMYPIHNGSRDGGLAKFDYLGNCHFSTYLGGLGIDHLNRIKLNQNNQLLIVGETQSANNIAIGSSYFPTLAGSYDAYLMKIN